MFADTFGFFSTSLLFKIIWI
uniref:Uncharacterized protein n=1 Tax=Arundo donax TaxID=35708 RepID=A0A0A9BW70_ARUDO